jgi:hypothetical protein
MSDIVASLKGRTVDGVIAVEMMGVKDDRDATRCSYTKAVPDIILTLTVLDSDTSLYICGKEGELLDPALDCSLLVAVYTATVDGQDSIVIHTHIVEDVGMYGKVVDSAVKHTAVLRSDLIVLAGMHGKTLADRTGILANIGKDVAVINNTEALISWYHGVCNTREQVGCDTKVMDVMVMVPSKECLEIL